MNDEKKEALSLMAELVKMAQADKDVREAEHQFLQAIAIQLGLDAAEFKMVFETYIEFTPQKPEFDRILQFHRLVLLMNVDTVADDRELALIKDLGIRMGLHPSATTTILEEMHNYPNKIVPPNRLIEVFKTFHN